MDNDKILPVDSETDENLNSELENDQQAQSEHGVLEVKEEPSRTTEKNSISADLIRGHINTIILRTLDERDKYGYEIINEIEQKSHGQYELKQPTLYSALKRLETQGYIQAYWKSDEVSSGGRRKYFRLTEAGKEITEKNRAEWEYSRTVIDSLISDRSFDFSQPAPNSVDFNILKKSTSRVPVVKLETVDGNAKISEDGQAFWERHQALADQQEQTLQQVLAEQQALSDQQEQALQQVLAEQQALAEQQILAEQRLASLKELEDKLNAQKQELEEEQQAFENKKSEQLQELEDKLLAQQQALDEQKAEQEEAFALQQEEFANQMAEQVNAIALKQKEIEEQHQQFLLEQEAIKQQAIEEARIRAERQAEEEQRKLVHENFLKLMNGQPQPQQAQQAEIAYTQANAPSPIYTSKPETERDYRNLINNLFLGTISTPNYPSVPKAEAVMQEPIPTYPCPPTPPSATQSAEPTVIQFGDAKTKALDEGLRINTAESYSRTQEKAPYSKGLTLFKSSLIVGIIMLLEFALCLLFKDALAVETVYPLVILAINCAQVGICAVVGFSGLIQNNRRPTSNNYISTSIIICIVSILIICLTSLLIQVNFSSIADITAKIIIPCIIALNIPVFTVSFYLLSK